MQATGGSSDLHGLKRGATSLSDELQCSFCGRRFSASHQLDKHERTSCLAAKKDLSNLLQRREELRPGRQEPAASKRRRLETEGETNLGDNASTNALSVR